MTGGGLVFGRRTPLAALQSLLGGTIMGFAWALIQAATTRWCCMVPSLALHGISPIWPC